MEEHRLILEMVAEGKITVEQGEKLLDALRDTAPARDPEPEIYVSARHDDPGSEILAAISQAIGVDTLPRVRRVRRMPRARAGASVDRIVHFASSGVPPRYVREMHEVFEDVTSDELINLSHMGVKPGYVEALKEVFEDDISVDEIINLSNMGVKAAYVEEIKEAFGDDISVDEIINLSNMGVSAKYIEELHDAGIETPTVKDVLKNKLDT